MRTLQQRAAAEGWALPSSFSASGGNGSEVEQRGAAAGLYGNGPPVLDDDAITEEEGEEEGADGDGEERGYRSRHQKPPISLSYGAGLRMLRTNARRFLVHASARFVNGIGLASLSDYQVGGGDSLFHEDRARHDPSRRACPFIKTGGGGRERRRMSLQSSTCFRKLKLNAHTPAAARQRAAGGGGPACHTCHPFL